MENRKNEFEREAMDLEELDQVNGGMGEIIFDSAWAAIVLAGKGIGVVYDWVKGIF